MSFNEPLLSEAGLLPALQDEPRLLSTLLSFCSSYKEWEILLSCLCRAAGTPSPGTGCISALLLTLGVLFGLGSQMMLGYNVETS